MHPETSPNRKKSPKKVKPSNKWLLKPNSFAEDSSTRNDKKLKQTTLGLKLVEVKRDITKLRSFNGGIHSTSSENIPEDLSDDDIVASSPGERKLKPPSTTVLSINSTAKKKLEMNV